MGGPPGFGQANQGFGQANQGFGQANQGFPGNQGFGPPGNQGFPQGNQGFAQSNPSYPQNNGYPPAYAPPGYPPGPGAFAATAAGPADAMGTREVARPKLPPKWIVAVGSGLAVLVVVGLIATIFAVVNKKPAATAGTAPRGSSSAGGGVAGGTPGVFGAARAGFLAAATPAPLGASSPDPTQTGSASAASPTDTTGAGSQNAGSPVAAAPSPPPQAPDPVPAAAPQPVAQPVARTYEPQPAPAPAPVPVQVPTPVRSYAQPTPVPQAGGGGGGAKGYLSIICLPGCDRVEVDGQSLGASLVFKHPTPVGTHRIRLISSNPPANKTVTKSVVADSVAMVRESMP
jgi:hypothetical protein